MLEGLVLVLLPLVLELGEVLDPEVVLLEPVPLVEDPVPYPLLLVPLAEAPLLFVPLVDVVSAAPVVLLPMPLVESLPLIVPDAPDELPFRLRRERRDVLEVLVVLFEFWSIAVLDWPVALLVSPVWDAFDCVRGDALSLTPEVEL